MAAISVSRRSTSGILLIVAGALVVIAALLPYLNVSFPWMVTIAWIALAAALLVLGFGAVNSTVAKAALIAAGAGWAVLALNALLALPAVLVSIATFVAAIGGVIGAVVVLVGREIANVPAIVFLVATLLGALYLLGLAGTLGIGMLWAPVFALFGVALVITGVLFRMREHRRR